MDITFLVGNGFDLSLGYKTSYKDFYDYYLQQPNDPDHEDAISLLKKSIDADRKHKLEKWSDFEIGLGKFTQSFSTDQADAFIDAYDDAVQSLDDYLSNLPQKQDINFITDKQWGAIRKQLCCFYQESKPIEVTEFSNLKTTEQSNGWEATFHVVSFNYTNYLDKYVAKIAQEPLETWKRGSEVRKHVLDPNVFHVHGLLNDYPVIGISSEDQILNQAFRKNDDLRFALIKSNIIDEIGYHRYTEFKDIINKSRIICLLGLSLGDSDKHWWDYINNWLMANQNRSIFIFEYTDTPPSNIHHTDLRRKTRKVIYRLLNHSKISDTDKQNLAKRIHVIFNTKKVLVFPRIYNEKLLH